MNDLHRVTDRFTVITDDGRELTVVEYTPSHEVRTDGTTAPTGIKGSPRLETPEGDPVRRVGDDADAFEVVTGDGTLRARRAG